MNSVAPGRSGCYGKIPRRGDFITRCLDSQLVGHWDEWLQDGISMSRESLGERWIDHYMVSPVWSFAAGGGSLDQSTWLGVLIPSVDRVGRYFPFSVMVNAGDCSPLAAMYCWRSWFDAARELALDSLADEFDPETLESRLAALPKADARVSPRPRPEDLPALADAGRQYQLGHQATTQDVLASIAGDVLLEIYPACSVWWTQGSESVPASVLLSQGMPPARGFAALLDGQFSEAGWTSGGVMGAGEAYAAPAIADSESRFD